MTTIAFYGGSFNPVHLGHLKTAQFVCDYLNLSKLYFLPNAAPPHKNTVKLPFNERAAMLEGALADLNDERLKISYLEQDESILHFTYDTLTKAKEQHPEAELYFIMGMDSLLGLHTWKRGLEIINLANLIVLKRPGYELSELNQDTYQSLMANSATKMNENLEKAASNDMEQGSNKHRYYLIDSPEFEVSSTQLRELIDLNPSTPDPKLFNYLSKSTVDYIYAHGFYGAHACKQS